MQHRVPTIIEIRKAAVLEEVDPRTLQKALQGVPVRGVVGARVQRAIERLRAIVAGENKAA